MITMCPGKVLIEITLKGLCGKAAVSMGERGIHPLQYIDCGMDERTQYCLMSHLAGIHPNNIMHLNVWLQFSILFDLLWRVFHVYCKASWQSARCCLCWGAYLWVASTGCLLTITTPRFEEDLQVIQMASQADGISACWLWTCIFMRNTFEWLPCSQCSYEGHYGKRKWFFLFFLRAMIVFFILSCCSRQHQEGLWSYRLSRRQKR